MVVRISGSAGISFNDEPFATEPFVTSALEDIPVFQKKIAAFTGDGTWTVPAGVTYAIAHMLGGGGGVGSNFTGGDGGDSSVDFASGLVTAPGGVRGVAVFSVAAQAAPANSGQPAPFQSVETASNARSGLSGGNSGTFITAGALVTPADSISVTVGAGGSAGTGGAAGGSGYVYIEYYEEI